MSVRRMDVRPYLLAIAATALLVSACTQDGTPPAMGAVLGNSAAANGTVVPNLYLDRSLEFLVAGVPARGGYFKQVERCENAGMPMAPLSDADAGMIATGRRQYWRTAEAVAYREETWSWDVDALCDFHLRRTGTHAYFDAAGATYLDLVTGEVTSGPHNARHMGTAPADPETTSTAAGWTGPTMRKVAGQPCEQWKSRHGAMVCAWAGGTQWGYNPRVTSVYDGAAQDSGALVLEAGPPPGMTGIRVSTESFVIGGKVDLTHMRPPELDRVQK